MAERSWSVRYGLTPVRVVLVVVLSIVLVAVLWSQFAESGDAVVTLREPNGVKRAQQAAPLERRRPTTKRPLVTPAAIRLPVDTQWRPWRRMTVEQATAFNPLDLPTELGGLDAKASQSAEASAVQIQQQRDEVVRQRDEFRKTLQETGVRMIVVGPQGKSAYLGNELVHEGDVIHGFLIEEIREDGVDLIDAQ